MPLGAFIADQKLMAQLTENPVLGHITTFGGHPISCTAGMEAFRVLIEEDLITEVKSKSAIFKQKLVHRSIRSVNSSGLWMAVEFDSFQTCKKIIDQCISKGLLTDWFLFSAHCLRISPPLTISIEQIEKACRIILDSLDQQGQF